MKYYVRDNKGRIAGPFDVETLIEAAREGRILPTWHLSSTQEKWTLAATVPDLFPATELSPPVEAPAVDQRQHSIRDDQIAIFVDTFMGGQDRFTNSMLWIKKIRLWWLNLTLPSKGFILSELGPHGIKRLRYDFASERAAEISEDEFEKLITTGVRRVDWVAAFALVVGLVGLVWTVPDFAEPSNLPLGVQKAVIFSSLLILAYFYRAKRSKVYIGYRLTPETESRTKELLQAFTTLSRCSRVWALQLKAADQHWKYSIRLSKQGAHLPTAKFRRGIPNIATNITVCSVAFRQLAIYFLPEKLLVVDGKKVRQIAYRDLDVSHDHLDHLASRGHIFKDTVVIGHRWLHSRTNGLPDRRYKVNFQIPIVRCGILKLETPESAVGLITTDPNAPETFLRNLPSL